MLRSARSRLGSVLLRPAVMALSLAFAGLMTCEVQAQVTSFARWKLSVRPRSAPLGQDPEKSRSTGLTSDRYVASGQPSADPGPPIAAGWEKLGDGIVGNEPAGRTGVRSSEAKNRREASGNAAEQASNLDVRFVAHGWVIVWDRLVPLTDLSRDGSLYTLHPQPNGRVRITLDGRELFRDVLFADKYEPARTILEGR